MIKAISDLLDDYFPNPEIPLHFETPFQLLVAVVLSAHTTDKAVNRITEKLFKRAATAEEMATVPLAELEKLLQSLGLYRVKAKYLHGLSLVIATKYKGKVPAKRAALEKLPGVGHKTASVVLVQAFGIPAFPVDTHIKRLSLRWGLSKQKTLLGIENDLKNCFPRAEWGKRHLQIILFGRTYCKARGHDPKKCPICAIL